MSDTTYQTHEDSSKGEEYASSAFSNPATNDVYANLTEEQRDFMKRVKLLSREIASSTTASMPLTVQEYQSTTSTMNYLPGADQSAQAGTRDISSRPAASWAAVTPLQPAHFRAEPTTRSWNPYELGGDAPPSTYDDALRVSTEAESRPPTSFRSSLASCLESTASAISCATSCTGTALVWVVFGVPTVVNLCVQS